MKAIRLLLVSFFVLCVSTANVVASNKSASNESDKAKIQRAMKAAPNQISDHATIMDADGIILRPGSNGWTCFPGVPLIPGDKHPMCNDAVWMAWLGAIIDGSIFYDENDNPNPWRPSTIGYSYMLLGDALVNNGNPFAEPGDPGIWDQEGPHLMMLFPTSVDLGHLPQSPHDGGPYVMWGETDMVHVMVPLTDK